MFGSSDPGMYGASTNFKKDTASSNDGGTTVVNNDNTSTPKDPGKARDMDYRARLQLFRKSSETFFDPVTPNVLTPLIKNRGIVFPYTPNLFLSRNANYGSMDFKGANFPVHTYMSSSPPILPLIATFTATTKEEGQYMLAAWRFLNILTQSDFGESSIKQNRSGTPPPVLQFSYLGPFGFDRVPVLLTDFNIMLGNQVDMVPVEHPVSKALANDQASAFGNKEVTYMPTELEFTINLVPQYSPRRVRKDYNLDAMRKGRNIGFL